MKPTVSSIAALALLVSVVPNARAQASGFALDRFEPSERGSEWFANESLDLRGHFRPSAGVVLDYADKPLVLYDPDGSARASIVRMQLFAHLGASVNIADRFRLAISIPVAAAQSGEGGSANGFALEAPTSADVGDVRLGADARVLGVYGDPLTLALGVQVHLPSGRRESYTGDETFRFHPRAIAAGEFGPLAYSAHAGIEYRPFDAPFAGSSLGSQIVFGAAGGVKALAKRLVLGPEVYGSTVVGGDEGPFKTRNSPFEALFGAHYTFFGEWRAGAAAGPGLSRGYGTPAFRLVASIEWTPPYEPPEVDRDHDGVPDRADACPDAPGDRHANGCSPDTKNQP
jgi:hypothetical protein